LAEASHEIFLNVSLSVRLQLSAGKTTPLMAVRQTKVP
jgi:hypothetical protein